MKSISLRTNLQSVDLNNGSCYSLFTSLMIIHSFILETYIAPLLDTTTQGRSEIFFSNGFTSIFFMNGFTSIFFINGFHFMLSYN